MERGLELLAKHLDLLLELIDLDLLLDLLEDLRLLDVLDTVLELSDHVRLANRSTQLAACGFELSDRGLHEQLGSEVHDHAAGTAEVGDRGLGE